MNSESVKQRFSKGLSLISYFDNKLSVKSTFSNLFEFSEEIDDKLYLFKFWDTLGEERYGKLDQKYIQGADALILVTSFDKVDAIKNLTGYINKLKTSDSSVLLFIICNKKDVSTRLLGKKEISDFSASQKIPLFFTSTEPKEGLDEAFESIKKACYQVNYDRPKNESYELTYKSIKNTRKCC